MTYYRRREMTDAELALAGALGAAVGAATFYLVRIWLQREPLPEGPPGLAERAEPEAERESLSQGPLEPAEPEAELEAEPDIGLEAEGAQRPPR